MDALTKLKNKIIYFSKCCFPGFAEVNCSVKDWAMESHH